MTAESRSPVVPRATVVVAVVAFVVLALPKSGLGTAWPAIRTDFDRPVGDLGTMLAVYIGAYGVASAVTGRMGDRIATWILGAGSAAAAAGGLLAFAVVPTWVPLVAAAGVVGIAGGALDTALNGYAAHRFTTGAMNLLHAGFGLGATIGPLVMSTVIDRGWGWRVAYVVFIVVELALVAVFVRARGHFPVAHPEPSARRIRVGREPVVVVSLAVFFVYTGIEIAAGQWAFTVLEEGRGLSTAAAGGWVAAYFGGLTAGRLLLGGVGDRLGPAAVLRWSIGLSVVATTGFAVDAGGSGMVALPILGFGLAGVFPTLMLVTPERVGRDRANAMVGYQLAAASVGGAFVPWVGGRLVEWFSLEAIGPLLVTSAAVLAVFHAIGSRLSPIDRA